MTASLHKIGSVVQEWRLYRGLSVTDLAKLAGISKSYVSGLETGRIQEPRVLRRQKLATALGITEKDLVLRRLPGETKQQEATSESQFTPFETIVLTLLGEILLEVKALRREHAGGTSEILDQIGRTLALIQSNSS